MFKKLVNFVGGNPHKKEIDRASQIVEQINGLEAEYEKLSTDALCAKTDDFRARMHASMDRGRSLQEALDELVPEAFAAVREASKRTIGLRHYDVQLIGGIALHSGKIAEMRTGEGKTLVATLPLYLNALTGRGAHLVTVNDYLARRDARWMAPIYRPAGPSVGVLQMAAPHRERPECLPDRPGERTRPTKTSTSCAWSTAARPTRPTSPTAPTPSLASTTCATT